MSEHQDQFIVDSQCRRWKLLSKSGTAKDIWDLPGATFDASAAAVGDHLIVPALPGTMTFERVS